MKSQIQGGIYSVNCVKTQMQNGALKRHMLYPKGIQNLMFTIWAHCHWEFLRASVDFSVASVELSERLRKLGGSLQFQLSVCDYWVGLDWQVGRWREGKTSPASPFLLLVINRLIHSTGLTLWLLTFSSIAQTIEMVELNWKPIACLEWNDVVLDSPTWKCHGQRWCLTLC